MNDDGSITALIKQLYNTEIIRTVIYRQCRGTDRLDRELILSCYHPDATEDHGGIAGPVTGIFTPEALATLPRVMHHSLGQIDVAITGESARVESYAVVTMLMGAGDEVSTTLIAARYLDRFERRDGEWKIAHRTALFDAQTSVPGGEPQVPQASQGRQDRQDPVYALFGANG